MSEQLELSFEAFSVRFPLDEALRVFRDTYWDRLPKGRTTRKCFERIATFCALRGVRYVDEFSQAHMENLRDWLAEQNLKANTVNTHHVIVSRLYAKLYEWKKAGSHAGINFKRVPLPAENPASQVPKVDETQFARKQPWPKRLVYRLIAMAVKVNDLDLAETIEILYLTGLRLSDVWRITEHNVDLAHMVLEGIQNKTITSRLPSGRPYLIAITPRMATILQRRMERCTLGTPLFRNPKYSVETWARIIGHRFDAIRRPLGMRHVYLKDLRGSGATLLLDNAVDVETVREKYGWTTLRHIPTYARRTMVHQRQAQEILENDETEIIL